MNLLPAKLSVASPLTVKHFANVVTLVLNLLSELLLLVLVVVVLLTINVRLTIITLAISPIVVAAGPEFSAYCPRKHAKRSTCPCQCECQHPRNGERHCHR